MIDRTLTGSRHFISRMNRAIPLHSCHMARIRASAARCLLIPFLLAGCGELSEYDSRQVQSAIHDTLLTTTESWEFRMTLLEGGKQRVSLEGEYAVSYDQEDRQETRIEGPVYVEIFDSTGTRESEAWSGRAIYHPGENLFELFDSVEVRTALDRRLYSDYLRWSERTDSISSDRFVTIVTPADSITGSGFSGLTDLSSYVITYPRGRVIVD